MTHLLTFWYMQSLPWAYQSFLRSLQRLEGPLAVKDTLRNLTKPIFQDYTLQGRVVGFLLRLARVCLGSCFYLLTLIVYILIYLLWLIFPFLCVVLILGSFLAQPLDSSSL